MSKRKKNYEEIRGSGAPIRAWVRGVPFDPNVKDQLERVARLPIIYRWVVAMPDVHVGKGSAVGNVIATEKAVIPAAVGVDIGCGMMALRTSLKATDLPESLRSLRLAIEQAIPHGRTHQGGRGDKGAWQQAPKSSSSAWAKLHPRFKRMAEKHPRLARGPELSQLGTLGSGNHFVEVCLDEEDAVWFMLHSGSRGVGNRIGRYFIEMAKEDMRKVLKNIPDADLAYLKEGTKHYQDYMDAVGWAQNYARINRELMMSSLVHTFRSHQAIPPFETDLSAVNCHHNYVEREHHFGKDVLVTRKGALSARSGELGIIPGSMGSRSFIVRGLGNPESFHSCSHGAGRIMSRSQAKKRFTLADHQKATEGVECRQDKDVIDETPGAYKPIDQVLAAQKDLVEVVHTLKQVICVKG